jgi:polar amino acid transport system substrate-binding protein
MNQPEIKLAMVKGTVSADVGQRVFPRAEVQWFANDQQAEQALLQAEVHAFVTAKPKPRFLALRHPDTIDEPMARPLLGMAEAFAVRKGDADFVNFLNAWIVARSADFWIDSTRRYWFESLNWQESK